MNPGSDTFSITLRRDGPNQPWGFRLQGGIDFTTALSLQSVNPGSIAEKAGLQAGDAVLQINNRPSDELEHEQAKQEIVASGNEVFLVAQRGAVKIWKPKVTPMSELRPKEMNLNPDGSASDDVYIQKTSLAADKQDIHHIGTGYNRTARPFGAGFGGGAGAGGTVPAVVNAQYNSPIGMYSAENTIDTYQAQSAVLTGKMHDLTVSENESSKVVGPSPTLLAVQGNGHEVNQKRNVSPNFLAADMQRSRSPVFRGPSPTFRGQAHEEGDGSEVNKAAMFNEVLRELETSKDTKEGEEVQYQGYSNPRKQSRTFHLLEKGLARCDDEQEGASAEARQPVIRSVKAPVYDPSQHEIQQAQHMTCRVCGSLIIGVFVRIKGEPLHPECFKCCRCGKNLKNQGYFHIEGQMYCEVHAKEASRPDGQGMHAVPIYR